MTGKILEEEAVTALSVAFPIVGEEPPSGGLAEETRQPIDRKSTRLNSSH